MKYLFRSNSLKAFDYRMIIYEAIFFENLWEPILAVSAVKKV